MSKFPNPSVSRPPLTDDASCDAAVIGGGITGVLCAHALALRGLSVLLLEQRTVAHEGSKTARSTAKATVAHGRIYSTLAETVSAEASRKYAAANLAGLRFLHSIADTSPAVGRVQDMYLYALHGERLLRREFRAMRDGGIVCEYLNGNDVPLPFPVTAAIRLPGQLALDPVELCRCLCGMGHFRVCEHSTVTAVGRNSLLCNGHTVAARHIVDATNYPCFCPAGAGLPLKLFRQSSYAAAVRCDAGFRMPELLAFGIDGGYGYRYAPDGQTLIVSGETHRGAASPNAGKRLLRAAESSARDGISVLRHWSNNDGYTPDGIPYVGQLRNGVFIACGFGAWGMTNAASAALILAEQIGGRGLWYDDLFSPGRNFLRGGSAQFAEHLRTAIGGAIRTVSAPPDVYAGDVARGQADIINYHGKRAGAYRDSDGRLYVVDLRCPHLGCSLEWNPEERSWDCPCHGSRFDYTGVCISNPALRGISLE
ncbi:MAG: FAD-dependent oxidoreductase [Clostridia bacterium]|nr:FAD-dependent oxidoreductase [Clostridia bacterium]